MLDFFWEDEDFSLPVMRAAKERIDQEGSRGEKKRGRSIHRIGKSFGRKRPLCEANCEDVGLKKARRSLEE